MIKAIISILLVSLSVIFGSYFIFNNLSDNGTFNRIINPDDNKSCTLEAKVCPDGSAVGRSGPNCEFAACPTEVDVVEEEVTMDGTLICLPHKDKKGEQTLECAFGLQTENGKNYGLNDPEWKYLINTPMNSKVKITGILKSQKETKYDSAGIIEIKTLQKK